MIKTIGLTKQYGAQKAVDNVSMHVKGGEIYGLLGRNGAGKTSIMKMLLSLTAITSGEAFLFGKPINGNQKEIYPRIGSIIEYPWFYPNLTAYENLKVFAKLKGKVSKNAVENALHIVGLPCGDKKPFSKFSIGMKQRLGIANAIMNDPEILILDEPTNGLDPIGIAEMRSFIRDLCTQKGKTILISSHNLSEIEQMADTIGILHNGVLLEECSMKDISHINRKHISFSVSDTQKAVILLEQKYGITDYIIIEPDVVKIFDLSVDTHIINRLFLQSGIEVSAISTNTGNLEEHFKHITGGVGIA